MLAAGVVVLALAGLGAAVLVAGSGDGTGRATDTTRRTGAPRSSSTAASTSTTAPVSSTPVPRSTDPVVAFAQQYDGRYVGTFASATSGTRGTVTLEIRVDPATAELATGADFAGDLFGNGARRVRHIGSRVKLGDPNATIDSRTQAFGLVHAHIDQDLQLTLTADDVPGPKIAAFTLTGTLRTDLTGFDATYRVTFEDGSTADGTIAASCDPSGTRPSEVTTMCALHGGPDGP